MFKFTNMTKLEKSLVIQEKEQIFESVRFGTFVKILLWCSHY